MGLWGQGDVGNGRRRRSGNCSWDLKAKKHKTDKQNCFLTKLMNSVKVIPSTALLT